MSVEMPTQAATCATHPLIAAAATCTRCGRFVCGDCLVAPRPSLCSTCAPQVLDPYALHGRRFDLGFALSVGAALFRAEARSILVLALVFTVATTVLRGLVTSVLLDELFASLLGTFLSQAMLALFIAQAEGRQLPLQQALKEAARSWPRMLGSRITSGFLIGAGLLLFVVPGVITLTKFMFTDVAAMRVADGEVLKSSTRVVSGRTSKVFGLLLCLRVPLLAFIVFLPLVVGRLTTPSAGPRWWLIGLVWTLLTRFAFGLSRAIELAAFVMLHRDADVTLAPMTWLKQPPLWPSVDSP